MLPRLVFTSTDLGAPRQDRKPTVQRSSSSPLADRNAAPHPTVERGDQLWAHGNKSLRNKDRSRFSCPQVMNCSGNRGFHRAVTVVPPCSATRAKSMIRPHVQPSTLPINSPPSSSRRRTVKPPVAGTDIRSLSASRSLGSASQRVRVRGISGVSQTFWESGRRRKPSVLRAPTSSLPWLSPGRWRAVATGSIRGKQADDPERFCVPPAQASADFPGYEIGDHCILAVVGQSRS